MSNTNTGGPAFPSLPIVKEFEGKRLPMTEGMTLRDYFASSFVASGHVFVSLSAGNTPDEVAKQAYALADAMLKSRNV
jgi:hypothetical protein